MDFLCAVEKYSSEKVHSSSGDAEVNTISCNVCESAANIVTSDILSQSSHHETE
jgi:hypothetical protein